MSGVQTQNLAHTWHTFVYLVTEIHQFEPNSEAGTLLKSTWNLLLHIYDSGIGVHLQLPNMYHLFKVVENRMQQLPHIVHSCQQYQRVRIIKRVHSLRPKMVTRIDWVYCACVTS